MKIYQMLILCVMLSSSGCGYSRRVKNMGKSTAILHLTQCCIDSQGNLILETDLTRRPANYKDPSEGKKLGKRYLILNAHQVEKAIRSAISHRTRIDREGKKHILIDVECKQYVHEDSMENASEWYLFPPNLLTVNNNASLPSYLATTELTCYSDKFRGFELEYTLDEEIYSVDFRIYPNIA